MKLTVNGTQHDVRDASSLQEVIRIFSKNPEYVIAEVNEHIIKKDVWAQTQIRENDTIELVTFVGGG